MLYCIVLCCVVQRRAAAAGGAPPDLAALAHEVRRALAPAPHALGWAALAAATPSQPVARVLLDLLMKVRAGSAARASALVSVRLRSPSRRCNAALALALASGYVVSRTVFYRNAELSTMES